MVHKITAGLLMVKIVVCDGRTTLGVIRRERRCSGAVLVADC